MQKEYECVAAARPAAGHAAVDFPVVVRNRMTKSRNYLLAEVIDGDAFHRSCWQVLLSDQRIRVSRSLGRRSRQLIAEARRRLDA